ncbi:MAG: isoprenylcysteine carboxylmethyltransferase family protein [Saprospiraceae bacterium]|nr:isoprenylcysteine carboxylmethyltransferase family protein [Saprospiraceae bacterium]
MALIEEFNSQGNILFRYRSYIPIIILVAALVLYYFQLHNGLDNFHGYYPWLCLGVSLLGLIIRVYTVGHTPKNTSGRNTGEGQLADTLNQTGIYSLVRHPLYLGNFLMYLGLAMITGHLWFVISFVLLYWLYYERIMFAEEHFLRNKFGEQYLKWAASVPAFVPKLGNMASPNLSFSWKKVLKKEKNGIAALFGLFYVFYAFHIWVLHPELSYWNNIWFCLFVSSLSLYLILKILKYQTNWLEQEGR